MTSDASKQSVLITGCSKGGIGDALAQEFHTRGFTVFATARNLDNIQHLKELGCDIFVLDVTDQKSIFEAVEYISKKTGGELHFLINNAGLNYRSTILDVDLPSFTQVFAVKVFGAVSMSRSFGPLLIKARGTICNMGSMAPYFKFPILMAYAGANSALEYLSHQMRMELDPFGVSVVHVIGGAVQSNIDREPLYMPQNSLYQPVRAQIIKSSYQHWDNMTAAQFASTLVSKLTQKRKPAMVYLGSRLWFAYLMSFTASCASWFIGVGFWDLVMSPIFGMSELKKVVEKEENEGKKGI